MRAHPVPVRRPDRHPRHRVAVAAAAAVVAAAALLAGPVAPAAAGPATAAAVPAWSLHGWSAQRWLADPSAATLTTSTLDGGGLTVERRILGLPLPGPFPVLHVSAELGFDGGSADGTTFQQLDNHVATWSLLAGARARLPVVSWLHVTARASVGGGRTSVRIADQGMTTAISDRAVTQVASTGLGLSLLPVLKRGSRFRVGFEVELGYQVTTATSVHAYPEDRGPAELTIPASYASLGDVDLDGWNLRIGGTVGF